MSTLRITTDHAQTTRLFHRRLITAREAATEIWRDLLTEYPFLANGSPETVLSSVEGLPPEIAVALNTPDPIILARQLLATPVSDGEAFFPLRDTILLRVWRAEGEQTDTRYVGELHAILTRLPHGPFPSTGPWFARHVGTLIAIAMDTADQIDLCMARTAR